MCESSEWSEEDDKFLVRLQAEHFPVGEIARIIGRERPAVYRRLKQLTPNYWEEQTASLPRCPQCKTPLTQEALLCYCVRCGYETPESQLVPVKPARRNRR